MRLSREAAVVVAVIAVLLILAGFTMESLLSFDDQPWDNEPNQIEIYYVSTTPIP